MTAVAVDRVYAVLRGGILSGTYPYGSRLGEVELAEALSVSRTPVREALRRLAAEGLVQSLPHRGARVATWTHHDLNDIFELRANLESYGASRAAQFATDEQIEQLRSLSAQMNDLLAVDDSDRLVRRSEINTRFHGTIVEASGNNHLRGLVDSLMHTPVMVRTFQQYVQESLLRSQRHHDEIVVAISARDGEWAGSVMRSHILHARSVAHCISEVHET